MVAYPQKRAMDYSYTGAAQALGDGTFPGSSLDNDLANLKASLDETIDLVLTALTPSGTVKAAALPTLADVQAAIDAAVSTATADAAGSATTATTAVTTAQAATAAAVAAKNAAQAAATIATSGGGGGPDLSSILVKANDLSDLHSAATARTNLGLGALAVLSTVAYAQLAASLQALLVPPGKVAFFDAVAAPTGWIKANGGTIGDASSGAGRANADTLVLFTHYWTNYTNSTRPILTSSGVASTRGVDAATDWAAHKRITITDLRGEFLRGVDDSRGVDSARVLGSAQAEMIGPHSHTGVTDTEAAHTHTVTAYGSGSGSVAGNGATAIQNSSRATSAAGAHSHALTIDNNTGTENRVRNVALLACIKL